MSSEQETEPLKTEEESNEAENSAEKPLDTQDEAKPHEDVVASSSDGPETTSPLQDAEKKASEEEGPSKTEEEKLFDSSRDMFQKVSGYLNGELALTLEDYSLLEKLNKMTTAKYSDMTVMAQQLYTTMEELNKKCNDLKPLLDQIDQIEKSVVVLEQEAHRLDGYSKRLETKFKKLEKR